MKTWLTLTALSLAGCSAEPQTGPELPPPAAMTLLVSAADGGELELDDGAAVSIPPGVLEEDGEVTLSRVCPAVFRAPGFGGCQYEVRTDIDLRGRLEVTVPNASATPDCILAQTDDGWRCLGDSTATDEHAAAGSMSRVAALTTRSVRPDALLTDDTCADLAFEPCGGDVVGTWAMERACGSRQQVTGIYSEKPDPYASCADPVYRAYPYSVSGTIAFTDEVAEIGGTALAFTRSGAGTMWDHELVTVDCLASVGESCHEICHEAAGVCECLIEQGAWNTSSGGGYEVTPDGLLLDENLARYCVSGDELVIEHWHPTGPYHVVYRRQ